MKKYTNQNRINGELSVRDMSEEAFEAYSGSDYKVIEKNGKFDILLNNGIVYEQMDFSEMEEFFTEVYNECFVSEEE